MGRINIHIDEAPEHNEDDSTPFMTEPILEKSRSLQTLVRGGSTERLIAHFDQTNNFFCPHTKNKKFELFLTDLFELELEPEKTKSEIVKFVRLIETFYSEKIFS